MNIINMEGFRQIPADVELKAASPDKTLEVLKRYGVGLITGCGNISTLSSLKAGTQVVDTVAYHGLQAQIYGTEGRNGFSLTFLLPDIRRAAVQVGFRLTLSAGKKMIASLLSVGSASFDTTCMAADEAASYYYEIFVRYRADTTIQVEQYCNRVLMARQKFPSEGSWYTTRAPDKVEVCIGSEYIFADRVHGAMTIGDIYIGTTDYGENYSAAPDLLGSVEVAACPVVAFEGNAHVNTLGKDVVKGLNSGTAEAGYLSLRPVDQPAVITFERPDVVGKKVLGVMAGLTFRSSSAPNNHLAWQVRQGAVDGPLMEETSGKGDQGSWTTLTRTFVTPLDNTPAWDERNMQFSLVLYNRNNT
ncbi:hypothetical protein [Escherichia coli]|uniref:hypothetical protein n=1 Tax=Escherichia coli TaxID=562 RepID=UPI001E4089D0|nr:hypothetical protein [Escherichia coli]